VERAILKARRVSVAGDEAAAKFWNALSISRGDGKGRGMRPQAMLGRYLIEERTGAVSVFDTPSPERIVSDKQQSFLLDGAAPLS
jgi:hypothetical protein